MEMHRQPEAQGLNAQRANDDGNVDKMNKEDLECLCRMFSHVKRGRVEEVFCTCSFDIELTVTRLSELNPEEN